MRQFTDDEVLDINTLGTYINTKDISVGEAEVDQERANVQVHWQELGASLLDPAFPQGSPNTELSL